MIGGWKGRLTSRGRWLGRGQASRKVLPIPKGAFRLYGISGDSTAGNWCVCASLGRNCRHVRKHLGCVSDCVRRIPGRLCMSGHRKRSACVGRPHIFRTLNECSLLWMNGAWRAEQLEGRDVVCKAHPALPSTQLSTKGWVWHLTQHARRGASHSIAHKAWCGTRTAFGGERCGTWYSVQGWIGHQCSTRSRVWHSAQHTGQGGASEQHTELSVASEQHTELGVALSTAYWAGWGTRATSGAGCGT